MSWTPPITWADSTVYDADDLDQQLKGNFEFLYDPPSCLSYNDADQAIGSSTANSSVTMQQELWDTDAMHSGGASPATHDINTAGRFLSFGMWGMTANGAGRRVLTLDPSSGQHIESRITDPAAVTIHSAQAHGTFELGTSDTVSLLGAQNSGATLTIFAFTAWMLNHWCGNP